MVKVIAIPPQEVPAMFPHVKGFIEKALEFSHGELDIRDVYHQLLNISTIMWVVTDAEFNIKSVVITDVNQYPKKRRIRVLIAGGEDLHEWDAAVIQTLTEWGKRIQASEIEVIGRKGWEKALAKHGFKHYSSILLKEI